MKRTHKRIVAVLLVVVVVVSTLVVGTVARPGRTDVTGFNEDVRRFEHGGLEELYRIGLGKSGDDTRYSLGSLSVNPSSEIRIPLSADLFTYEDGRVYAPKQAAVLRDLRNGKLTVRTRMQAGSKSLAYVQLDRDVFNTDYFTSTDSMSTSTGRTACISIKFADNFKDVNEIDFSFDIYLAYDGKIMDDLSVTVAGTFANPEFEMMGDMDYVDISDGSVAVADVQSNDVNFYIGDGVTVKRMVFPGRKYYGKAVVKASSEPGIEESWPEAYPTVQAAYMLETVNMRYGFSRVQIDPEHPDIKTFYVYGEDMTYFGTTDDWLVYSDVYFLSTELIESFTTEEYLEGLENAPISARVTVGEFEHLDIDEGELLAAENKASDEKTAITYAAETKVDKADSAVKRGPSGEKIDGNINVAVPSTDETTTKVRVVSGVDTNPNPPTGDKKAETETTSVKVRVASGADTNPNPPTADKKVEAETPSVKVRVVSGADVTPTPPASK